MEESAPTSIEDAAAAAAAAADDGDSPMHPETAPGAGWFQCDAHNLRILKAITLDGLGQTEAALQLWEESIAFVEQKLPPLDENSVVLRVQAALCAHHRGANDEAMMGRAKEHARIALETHHLLFGGGVARFRRRFRHDLELRLRPAAAGAAETSGSSAVDFLWPFDP